MYHKATLIYFSATGTTEKIIKTVSESMKVNITKCYDISRGFDQDVRIACDTIAVFAVPVYSGRIPQTAIESLRRFSGDGTPAVIVCVYGNREFDDALMELNDLVEENKFKVGSAAAFIAQHSIFPKVASQRPDTQDLELARKFGRKSIEILSNCNVSLLGTIDIRGNRPYRAIASIPLSPKTDKNCNLCGRCARECPAKAIDMEDSNKIDKSRCLSCAHCISICPKGSKRFGGILYWVVSKMFTKKYALRKDPYLIYNKGLK